MKKGLRRHIEWSANIDLIKNEILVAINSKSEIPYFPSAPKSHDIRWFQVPMDDIFPH